MKNILWVIALCLTLTACFESMEDRAVREAKEYTERNCPTPPDNNTILDSLTFDKATKTFCHHQRLIGAADVGAYVFESKRAQMHEGLRSEVRASLHYKIYVEEGYHFAFLCRSGSTGEVVFVDTIKNEEIR
ncbi:MAG: hypothetical protein IKX36_06235 [Prevotella sp.]|nr:hypothetical protein [Prevotella sp.]